MAENSKIHWTDDDELLSKFVMHRLTASEEDRLLSHLRECEKCKDAVRDETQIVAGTKLAGRSAMKDRLKSRLQTSENYVASQTKKAIAFDIPWTRVASLAAMLAIVIAVGVYNNWFSTSYWNEPTPPEQLAQEQPSPTVETSKKDERVSEAKREKDVAQSTGIPDEHRSGKQRSNQARRQERKGTDRDVAENELNKSVGAATSPEAGGRVGFEDARKEENQTRLTDEAMIPPPQAFWVEGHVNSSEAASGDGTYDQLYAQPKKQRAARAQEESQGRKDDQNRLQSLDQRASLAITLNQRPTSSLPPSQQYRQGQQGSVQTFIQDKNGNMDMTLYMDPLVSDSDLNSAIIETVGADSLVISLSNQRIGYRLPQALSEKVNRKTRQVK